MRRLSAKIVVCAVILFAAAFASHLLSMQAKQSSGAGAKPIDTQAPNVIAGEAEARRLLLLMDADKNGKVSRVEFMSFMAAEFDRLDVNKDGELDVKELANSKLATVHHGGVHR